MDQNNSINSTNGELNQLQQSINQKKEDAAQMQNELEQQTIEVDTLFILAPISPVTYKVQVRSIEKITHHLHGITTTSEIIGIKTIDNIDVQEGLFFGSVIITHADKSEILIDRISKADARRVLAYMQDVVEFQRKNVVNMTSD